MLSTVLSKSLIMAHKPVFFWGFTRITFTPTMLNCLLVMQENLKWLSLYLYKIDMVKLLMKKDVDSLWSLE